MAGRFEDQGVVVTVRAWSCAGVYAPWRVRVVVDGLADGRGTASFRLQRGRETRIEQDFPVRVSGVPATADVDLRVRAENDTLAVRGKATVKALFARFTTPVAERLPISRGKIAECDS